MHYLYNCDVLFFSKTYPQYKKTTATLKNTGEIINLTKEKNSLIHFNTPELSKYDLALNFKP